MDNAIDVVSGVCPNDRAGESEAFSEVDSCEGCCDFNLWNNWKNINMKLCIPLCKQLAPWSIESWLQFYGDNNISMH